MSYVTVGDFLPSRLVPLPILRERCRYIKDKFRFMSQSNPSENEKFHYPKINSKNQLHLQPNFTIRNYGYLCEKAFLDDSNYHRKQMLGNKNTRNWELKIPKLKASDEYNYFNNKRASEITCNSERESNKENNRISKDIGVLKSDVFHCDITKLRAMEYQMETCAGGPGSFNKNLVKFGKLRKKGNYKWWKDQARSEVKTKTTDLKDEQPKGDNYDFFQVDKEKKQFVIKSIPKIDVDNKQEGTEDIKQKVKGKSKSV